MFKLDLILCMSPELQGHRSDSCTCYTPPTSSFWYVCAMACKGCSIVGCLFLLHAIVQDEGFEVSLQLLLVTLYLLPSSGSLLQ